MFANNSVFFYDFINHLNVLHFEYDGGMWKQRKLRWRRRRRKINSKNRNKNNELMIRNFARGFFCTGLVQKGEMPSMDFSMYVTMVCCVFPRRYDEITVSSLWKFAQARSLSRYLSGACSPTHTQNTVCASCTCNIHIRCFHLIVCIYLFISCVSSIHESTGTSSRIDTWMHSIIL